MEANPVRIIQYFDGTKQSLIPLFQRPYTWEKEKWSTLWDDVMAHYGIEGTSHFMGAVVSIPVKTVPVGVNKHLVIDGQQRLTTLAILLVALRDAVDEKTANRIDDYLTNRHYDGADKLKLLPTQSDREAYQSLVLQRALKNTDSRINDAYHYFKQKLKGQHDGETIHPTRILEVLESNLQVVMINLGDTDDPYLIFESLNAKGQPLTQADLVRNYVLMQFRHALEPGGEQERIYEDCWLPLEETIGQELPNFLRHYCMKDGTEVEKRTVYSAVKTLLASLDNSSLENELKKLARLGTYYARFLDPAKESDAELSLRLSSFVDLNVTTCYPLLLRLFHSRDQGKISHEDVKGCLSLIESFVIRRAVCEVPTNSLGKMFMQWSKDYTESNVVGWLGSRMASGLGNGRWPSDSAFKTSFQTGNQYGRKATRHVLVSLERRFGHKEPVDLANATIEHVMPQELSPEWRAMLGNRCGEIHDRLLHTFGNLTLSGYNSELGNLPFVSKCEKLSLSHIELNRWICDQKEWNEDVIVARAATLADEAARLWEGPERF